MEYLRTYTCAERLIRSAITAAMCCCERKSPIAVLDADPRWVLPLRAGLSRGLHLRAV